MDKRSFLAIAVTFVVLLGWQMLYVAPRQKEAARKKAIQLTEQAAADSIAALEARREAEYMMPETAPEEAVASTTGGEGRDEISGTTREGSLPIPSAGAEAREFFVTTEKMNISLSSRGGEISGVELLDFARKNGDRVQLVPDGAPGGLSLELESGGRWEGTAGAVWAVTVDGREVADGEKILLGGHQEKVTVIFGLDFEGGGRLEKRMAFFRDGYEIGLSVLIEREGELASTGEYAISWESGLALNEKDVKGEKRQLAAMGMVGDEYYKESPGKFGKEDRKEHDGVVAWAAARSKYFLSAIITGDTRSGNLVLLGNKDRDMIGYSVGYPFRGDPRRVEDEYTCYFGPLDMETLKAYNVGLEKAIELGKLRFFSVFVLKAMMWLKGFIPNYGLIIIILSILTKVLFYRLTHKSFKSMKDMQKLQPKLKELQEKYKNDKEKLNKATMEMYKEAGVNPLGGCLPLLFQMPVFIALFNVLRNTIELRDAPLGLWINDLSTPDVLFDFGVNLPLLGSEFHLLPILMGGAMVLQSKLGGSPTGDAGPAAQTKMMSTMMPIVFTFIFYSMPSGLVLYWLVNNILSIIQQYYVHRAIEAEEQVVKEGVE